jgi:hypothetical protein
MTRKKGKKGEKEALLKSAKALGQAARQRQQELRDTLKRALGEEDYRRMQVATIQYLCEIFGDDPEMFATMYEGNTDDEGVIIPVLDVLKEAYPEEFKPGSKLYLIVDNTQKK